MSITGHLSLVTCDMWLVTFFPLPTGSIFLTLCATRAHFSRDLMCFTDTCVSSALVSWIRSLFLFAPVTCFFRFRSSAMDTNKQIHERGQVHSSRNTCSQVVQLTGAMWKSVAAPHLTGQVKWWTVSFVKQWVTWWNIVEQNQNRCV